MSMKMTVYRVEALKFNIGRLSVCNDNDYIIRTLTNIFFHWSTRSM